MSQLPSTVPLVRALSGDGDRGYELLILSGPVVIGVIALLGRSMVTTALAMGYILAFVLYLVWIGVTS
ncbi:hypothetical protein [Halocatena pleomorpha]|uniref:Uncharacterized protein n=1 Tax=Halocatena pleomorpha TaxID=1785090 RepID=A0A3P3RAH1_9EURY|nr:hypothetical protein [Halocatena pleomorpha]RRJ30375.1 hypothetical protein EIK79_10680 [Halocatena pleomorpha]